MPQSKATRGYVWVRVPTPTDVDVLSERLKKMGPIWDRWECKLYRDNILIYDAVVPWDERDDLANATPQKQRHLRVVPIEGGPFALEFMRHNDRWAPLFDCEPGDITAIADYIEANRDGFVAPSDQYLYDEGAFSSRASDPAKHADREADDRHADGDVAVDDAAATPDSVVPADLKDRFDQIRSLLDTFCQEYLDEEYFELCRDLAALICRDRLPVQKYQVSGWAAGIVNIIGRANFLSDASFEPAMSLEDAAKKLGTSPATMFKRAGEIRKVFDIMPMDPDWTVASRIAANPLAWMVETTDGLLLDARTLPANVQKQLADAGVIPHAVDDVD